MADDFEERSYEVDFLNCVVDKADNFKIIESDSHFSDFVGVHPSKIHQGKLFLKDIIRPVERQEVLKKLCKKDAPYIYTDFGIVNKDDEYVLVHCTAQNYDDSKLCRLVFADVSKSREKQQQLKARAKEMNHLVDLVRGGVCLFKVTPNMHIEVQYLNQGGCKIFGTTKEEYKKQIYRLDELIYPEDKTLVFQAIGKAVSSGEGFDLEIRVMPHKKDFVWCKFTAGIHRYDAEKTPVFHAMITDITKLKEAESRADEANAKLVNLMRNLSGAIFFTNYENPFKLDLISGDFVKLVGYSRSELFDRFLGNFGALVVDGTGDISTEIKAQIEEKGKSEVIYQIRAKMGEIVTVRDVRNLVIQKDGSKVLNCEIEEIKISVNA